MRITFVLFLVLISTSFTVFSYGQNEEYKGTQKFLKGVGAEYDKEGKGFDIEYVLEGVLHNFILVDPERKSITLEYDSKGIAEDVLIIYLPSKLIDEPLAVYVNGDKEPNAIRSQVEDISRMIIPLYEDSKTITIEGTKVISNETNQKFLREVAKEFDADGKGFDVEYSVNGNLLNLTVNASNNSIILEYDSNGKTEDELVIFLPEKLIEQPLSVYVNGEKEIDSIFGRYGNITKMIIPLDEESKEIVVYGAKVIPEFGVVASAVLLISFASIITMSLTKRSFFRTY